MSNDALSSHELAGGYDAVRRTARLFVLDRADRILLIRIIPQDATDPANPLTRPFWITPGGQINPGEDVRDAAIRELKEETGLEGALVEVVGRGTTVLRWKGVPTLLDETFFLARVDRSDVDIVGMEDEERSVYQGHAWLSHEELQSLHEIVLPRELPMLMFSLATCGVPDGPLVIDLSTPQDPPGGRLSE